MDTLRQTMEVRLSQLKTEREQLRAEISEQLKRNAAELNARAAAAMAPHDRAIAELEGLLAQAATSASPVENTVGCGLAELPAQAS